jgi:hypothetical protein
LLGAGSTCGEIHPALARSSHAITTAAGASHESSSKARFPNDNVGFRCRDAAGA